MTVAQTRIPLSAPVLGGNEAAYLQACVDENWLVSGGRFVHAFEQEFARRHGQPDAVSTASGTAALHLALHELGIGPGDEVIVPALTFVATANPVRYVGADVVLADVDPVTYTIDPESVRRLIGPRTRAIVPVHLFGHPADMDALTRLAEEHGLWLIEDATEALGSLYRDRACGLLGDVGCFSFNGNKVITSGGGGMLLARDPSRLARLRSLSRQAREPGTLEYLHSEVGFNYVLSNLHAAVGLAQFERLDELVVARRAIARRYADGVRDVPGLTVAREAEWAESNHWLSSVLVEPDAYGEDRISLAERCAAAGIEVRPFFQPLHQIVPYADARRDGLPVAESLHDHGVNLPSSASLRPEDQERVLAVLRRD